MNSNKEIRKLIPSKKYLEINFNEAVLLSDPERNTVDETWNKGSTSIESLDSFQKTSTENRKADSEATY